MKFLLETTDIQIFNLGTCGRIINDEKFDVVTIHAYTHLKIFYFMYFGSQHVLPYFSLQENTPKMF